MTIANPDEQQVRNLRFACLAVAVALALGLWAHLPYLAVEHRRLETWKIAGLWIGDVAALLWFARFAFVHAVFGEPLVAVKLGDGRRGVKLVTLAVVAAILVDLAFTLLLMRNERQGYGLGQVAEAQIVAMKERRRAAATWYELDCRFKDETGQRHEAHLRVEAEHHELPATLPADTARAFNTRGEGPIRIRYDRQFPARAWVDGPGWQDDNAIYWFSLLTLFFQTITTALFLLLLRRHSAGGYLPWWWDVYNALPLAVESFWMLTMGLIDRFMDGT